MAIKVDKALCTGCRACETYCPSGALSLNHKGKIVVNEEACTECYLCQSACPVCALVDKNTPLIWE